jgi:hypothetical protein
MEEDSTAGSRVESQLGEVTGNYYLKQCILGG